MFLFNGTADQLYSMKYGSASSTRSNIASCAMPRMKVAHISSKPKNLGICIHVLQLYCVVEYVQCIRRLELYDLNNASTHNNNTLRRTAAGRLIALCTYLQPWRGTSRGLRSFRACTTTRMKLEGRNVSCKRYCANGLQLYLICSEDVTAVRRTLFAKATDMFSGHTIASPSSSNLRTSAN